MNGENRLLKWALVIAPTVAAVLAILPPSQKLKGGIDLVGGTSLLYEIDTTGMERSETVGLAQRVMAILQKRVDPNKQLNLVWRPVGNNRLEIQMPRPPEGARERRARFDASRDAIRSKNITRNELEAALHGPAGERKTRLQALGRGVDARHELLDALVGAYDDMVSLRGTDDVEAEDEARDAYESKVAAVLMTNVGVGRLADTLALGRGDERTRLLERLKADAPGYTAEIDDAVAKYDAWAKDKSVLEDASDLKRLIRGAGVLEFRILADRDLSSPTQTKSTQASLRQPISRYVDQLHQRGARPKAGDRYRWLPIEEVIDFLKLKKIEDFERVKETLPQIVERYAGGYYALVHADPEFGLLKSSATKWSLKRAFATRDSQSGRPAVSFTLDARGGSQFARLTGDNVQRQLAIVLDGVLMSHATILSQIRERGQITGKFTPQQVQELVNTLEAGSLPARLKETPLMEKDIGPSLGKTNREQGMKAAAAGLILVVVFVAVYYLFAGLVANVALVMNLLFVLAVMATMQATFTLPGIAALILTVGMAVDANVLIFERIREELNRGLILKKALKNGYDKALSTIVDANLTTLITCVILGYVGSEEVKGFAIVLGFGIATSMFTSLFVTRLVFTTLIDRRWLQSLPMLRLVGRPSFDWLGLRRLCWPLSTTALVGGVALFGYVSVINPDAVFDIEFLGGTSVQVELKSGVTMTDEELRQRITATATTTDLSAVGWLRQAANALTEVVIEPEANQAGSYRLESPTLTATQVGALLRTTFESNLEPDGVTGTSHTAVVRTRPESAVDLAGMRRALAEAAEYARQAAERLAGAKIQTVEDVERGATEGETFEIVTVETRKELVQAAVLAALGEELEAQRPIDFTVVVDPQRAPEGYFPIEEDHRYLEDVVPGTGPFDVQAFKGGVAMVFDHLQPPQRIRDVEKRVREIRLQPEFEQFEWRDYRVLGLGGGAGEDQMFDKVALVVVDENLPYYDSPSNWAEFLAKPELEVATAALRSEKSLRKVVQFSAPVASQAQQKAIQAMVLALAAIVAYIWIRFGTMQYGLAAIVALVHDVGITLGLITLCDLLHDTPVGRLVGLSSFKIDLPMIAALLTIIGYSLNDTIVLFDRIRENRGRVAQLSSAIINQSISQTLSRTLLTSFTTFIAVTVMYAFGGAGIHGFSFALMCGVIVGTYSSIAVATPLLYRPYVLHIVVYVLIGVGIFGAVAALAGAGTLLWSIGAVIVVALVAAIMIERGSHRGRVAMAGA